MPLSHELLEGVARRRALRTELRKAREGRRRCARCELWLPLDDFGPDARARDGRRSACRCCEGLADRRRKRGAS